MLVSVWIMCVWHGFCVFSLIWDHCRAPLNAVYVLPLAVRLCGCALCKHLVTAAVERVTTEQWTASWSIYYCLLRFTSRIAFSPLWVITRKWAFDLWCILGKKNFKCNIVNTRVLITTVITTKYLDSPEVGGFSRCLLQCNKLQHRKQITLLSSWSSPLDLFLLTIKCDI